jgi:hypothetical protein
MIQLDWDNPQQNIIRYTFVDPWTWDEYYATNIKRDQLFASSSQTIDIILDFTEGAQIPGQAVTHFRKAAAWDSPKRGVVVIVGVNLMLQALGHIMTSVFPQIAMKAPRPAKNLEAARRLIWEIRLQRDQANSKV